MATTHLLSLPTPCAHLVSSFPNAYASPTSSTNSRWMRFPPGPPIYSRLPCASSSSTSPAPLLDDVDLPGSSEEAGNGTVPFSGCNTCGREEIESGCNGEGRIQGGIATVPGFGWWPIKAYRPCPGFVASGGRYRRKGQSMDEVASGGGGRGVSAGIGDEVQTRKKKRGQRKSKK